MTHTLTTPWASQPSHSCILWYRWVTPAGVSGAKYFWTQEGSKNDISPLDCTQGVHCSCVASGLRALWFPRRSELKKATDIWHWSLQAANSTSYFAVLWGRSITYSVLPVSQCKLNCEYKLAGWCEGNVLSVHANTVRILAEKLSSIPFSYSMQHGKYS